jgi:hypothetical protein
VRSANPLLAIDVAILVPPVVADRARAISLALAGDRAGALRLDDTHLPHMTLAQQFVELARLDDLEQTLDHLLRHEPPLLLRIAGISVDHGTVHLVVDSRPDLQRVHETVMDAIKPFEAPAGAAHAFRSDGEAVRPQDMNWVRNYRERSAYAHFRPHVTVGHGELPAPLAPIDFPADRVAVCQLGRFCTCRSVLREWTLGRS